MAGKKNAMAAKPTKITPAGKARTKGEIYNAIAGAASLTRKQVVAVFDALGNLLAADLGKKGPGIFNVPGVGRTLFQAILRGEGPTIVSFVTVMVLLYLVVNLVIDLLYAVLDPRIRYA